MRLTKNDLLDEIFSTELPLDRRILYLQNLDYVLDTLEEREKCLIKKRYYEQLSLKKAGKKIVNCVHSPCSGVSTERARQILAKVKRKLKHPSRLQYWNKEEI